MNPVFHVRPGKLVIQKLAIVPARVAHQVEQVPELLREHQLEQAVGLRPERARALRQVQVLVHRMEQVVELGPVLQVRLAGIFHGLHNLLRLIWGSHAI